jgi:hypothetical protein
VVAVGHGLGVVVARDGLAALVEHGTPIRDSSGSPERVVRTVAAWPSRRPERG